MKYQHQLMAFRSGAHRDIESCLDAQSQAGYKLQLVVAYADGPSPGQWVPITALIFRKEVKKEKKKSGSSGSVQSHGDLAGSHIIPVTVAPAKPKRVRPSRAKKKPELVVAETAAGKLKVTKKK